MQRMNEAGASRSPTYPFNAELLYLNNVSYAEEKVCSKKTKNKIGILDKCARNLVCGGVFEERLLQYGL